MTAMNLKWGPSTIGGIAPAVGDLGTLQLSDADNSLGSMINLPRSGTITEIGFFVATRVGTPPAYNVGIVTVDASGRPTTTAYGGSAITSYTPLSTGWKWVVLSTPATAVAGAYAALRVYPSGTPPDASNYISVESEGVAVGGVGMYFTSSWVAPTTAGMNAMAIKYDTGYIYGFCIGGINAYENFNVNSTPDEIGSKFTVPIPMTIIGIEYIGSYAGTISPYDVTLYDASNGVLATMSVTDKDFEDDRSTHTLYFGSVNLAADTIYRITVKPTATNQTYMNLFKMDSADSKKMFPQGENWQRTERTNAGAWTDTELTLMMMCLIVSDITFASAAGGEFAYIGG